MFPIDLKHNSNGISFTRDNNFAVIVADNPPNITVLNLKSNRIKSRIELTEEETETFDIPLSVHVVDHPQHPDHKFIVVVTRNFSVLIYSYEDLRLLYSIKRDPLMNNKNEKANKGFV